MSLINKMLQDLDARAGQPGAAAIPSDIRPVLPPERSLPWKRIAIAAAVAVALAALGFTGWRLLGQKSVPAPAPAVTEAPAPAQATAPSPAAPQPAVVIEIPVPPRRDLAAAVAPVATPVPAEPKAAPAAANDIPQAVVEAAKPAAPATAPVAKAERAPQKPEARVPTKAATKVAAKVDAEARAGRAPAARKAAPPSGGGRIETALQRAENAYRRALASLEDGRVTEAIAGLQAALKAEPRHEPSRQTLVSLLVEAKRPDEAMRQLEAALALDPRQPSMAMLLARLQVERGLPAVDTLMRTLPAAAGNGDYHAFLAGVLQREGRHREAAEHYGAALRTAPQNGVWWMGLGISLQAEKRNLEAGGAFQKALDSGALSSELQGFVERKIKQLR